MIAGKSALVCAPHTDDAELGCGGTIAKFAENGIVVHVAAFSYATESLPPGSRPDRLVDEMRRALASLGVKEENIYSFSVPVRRFPEMRQSVLDEMITLRAKVAPDIVFIPSSHDVHQDHAVVHQEGLRAFRDSSILGYELPWNQFTTATTGFVKLAERHIDMKMTALKCYESQLELSRIYFEPSIMRGLAAVRGVQVKAPFAESFEVLRIII